MPVRQLTITSGQLVASQRHDLEGVVYVVTGTLKGRRPGTADLAFRWGTLTFSGALGEVDAYLGQPSQIIRGQSFLPGEGGDTPAVRLPVRNLPFASGASLLQLIDDGVYAWEETEASLRVAYVPPGRAVSGLVASDWTFLVKDGFFGPPEQIDLDGFLLPLHHRTIGRNRAFKQPRIPGAEFIRGGTVQCIASGTLIRDLGAPMPVVIGKPDSWYRPPSCGGGIRGYTLSSYASGARVLTFLLSTAGAESVLSGLLITGGNPTLAALVSGTTLYGTPLSGAGSVWWIHRQKPMYPASPLGISGSIWDQVSGTITIHLLSGLVSDVPKGALVLEVSHFSGRSYSFCAAGHPLLQAGPSNSSVGRSITSGSVAFQFSDGGIRPADPTIWRYGMTSPTVGLLDLSTFAEGYSDLSFGGDHVVSILFHDAHATFDDPPPGGIDEPFDILNDQLALTFGRPVNATPPVWFDPDFSPTEVVQQPAFTGIARLSGKLNFPTGGTGTNNANARDGSEATAASLGVGAVITLTFNTAPSPFVDGDTTTSTLWVMVQGNIDFTNAAGSITFGSATGTGGVTETFRFTQGTARDFDETVRCVGAGGSGGSVVEVWWEHDLETTEAQTRTADVILAGTSGTVSGQVAQGAPLEDCQTLFRVASTRTGFQGFSFLDRTSGSISSQEFQVPDPFDLTGSGVDLASGTIAYPTSVLVALQRYFLGPRFGSFLDVNSGVYQVAHERFISDDLRMGFVIQRPLVTWSELERDFALQARSQVYYGPSGHEIVYMEPAAGIAASGVVQEFRLAGVPGANAVKIGGRPLLERTRTDEIVNTATVLWDEDYVHAGNLRASSRALNSGSVALFGQRNDPRGDLRLWTYSPFQGHPVFSGARAVSGIAQFYADRAAFALTRFNFETAWPAFGVERGSPVRLVYQVADTHDPDETFRNVACEVEEIRCDPVNGERYQITARAVETPSRGLPAFTWIDRYTVETDVWTDRLLAFDAWRDRWSTP